MDALKEKLAIQEVELQKKNDAADKLIKIVEEETIKVHFLFYSRNITIHS